MRYLLPILMLLMCISCAPMPGPHLFPGLTHHTPIEDVSVNIIFGVEETSQACNALLAEQGRHGLIAANCLLNGCIFTGCATARWFPNGTIYRCDIYAAWDVPWIVDHELKHCEGYADKLY